MVEKVCESCGRVFEARRSTARFCSVNCRVRANRAASSHPIAPVMEPAQIPKSNFDDVAAAIDSARAVSNRLAQLSTSAPEPLRPGCARISHAITKAIEDEEW